MILSKQDRETCKRVLEDLKHYNEIYTPPIVRELFVKLVGELVEREHEIAKYIALLNMAYERPPARDHVIRVAYDVVRETMTEDTVDLVCEQAGVHVARFLKQLWEQEKSK